MSVHQVPDPTPLPHLPSTHLHLPNTKSNPNPSSRVVTTIPERSGGLHDRRVLILSNTSAGPVCLSPTGCSSTSAGKTTEKDPAPTGSETPRGRGVVGLLRTMSGCSDTEFTSATSRDRFETDRLGSGRTGIFISKDLESVRANKYRADTDENTLLSSLTDREFRSVNDSAGKVFFD